MTPIRKILMVLDPLRVLTPALDRATELARASKAQLVLGLYDRGPRLGLLGIADRTESQRLETLMREQLSRSVQELQVRLQADGLPDTELIDRTDRISASRILEDVRHLDADIVIKDVGHESAIRRMLFLPVDWELLQSSNIPIWMAGAGGRQFPQKIAAAVDPVHPEHGAGGLNRHILAFGMQLAALGQGTLQVYSAFDGLPQGFPGIDPPVPLPNLDYHGLIDRLRQQHRQALEQITRDAGIPAGAAKMIAGPVSTSLPEALSNQGADLLIVGSLRRRGLDRLIMGNTAERLIGESPCDVVVVPSAAPS